MEALKRFVSLNPAIFRSLIVSVVALLASVGIDISPDLSDNLIAVVAALAALVAGIWIRPGVTPNDKVVSYLPEPNDYPGRLMPGPAATTASDGVILYAARHGTNNVEE